MKWKSLVFISQYLKSVQEITVCIFTYPTLLLFLEGTKMKSRMFIAVCLLVVTTAGGPVWGAFIVETHSSGLAYSNFNGTGPSYTSTKSGAPGLTATNTAFGGNAVDPQKDTYVFSYTPGTDADNWIVPLDARYFGNGLYSTNLSGGQTGYYNVYITWPSTANVDPTGCNLYISHDDGIVSWLNVDGNTGGTNSIAELWGPFPDGTVLYGANDKWLKIADEVLLTAGNTYTVTQQANFNAYVSMRSAGVMWEFVAVPEPATLVFLGLGALGLRKRS